jgi:soluble lytic murein transglycosylase
VKHSGLILVFSLLLLVGQAASAAQTSSSPRRRPASQAHSQKKGAAGKKRRAAASLRVRRLNRAFVASAALKPMARQLLDNRSPAAYAGVEAYARQHAASDAGSLAWLADGYARLQDKQYPKAVAALQRAQTHAGDWRDYVDYFLASSYAAEGNPTAELATLRDFDARFPESLFLRDAMLAYGDALLAADHAPEAVRILEKYRNPTRPDIEFALGRAYRRTGAYAQAAEALRRVYYAYPLTAEADGARAELDRLAAETSLPPIGFAERKARADLLGQMHRPADAAREYRALLEEAPPASRNSIQMALGFALHNSGNDREARGILESAPETNDEDSARRWLALAEMARSASEEARFVDAVSHLRQAAPTSESLEQALLLGGNLYLLQKNYDKAIDYYRELQERFPQGKHASYAHWKAAWLTLRQGRTDEAKRAFEHQVAAYPDSPEMPAAMYWRARLCEDEGQLGRAGLWYQKLTYRFRQYYYAQLARARLEALPAITETMRDPLLEALPAPPAPANVALAAEDPPTDNLRYQKSLVLQNAGLTELAVKELRAAAPEDSGWANLQIARYYQENGLYHRAVQTLKRAVPGYFSMQFDSLPRPYWETLFPRPYWTDLTKYSRLNQLDPFLVASLIRQESEFNPGAVSRADALGLMQLLPVTGRKVARDLQLRRFSSGALLTPTYNMQLGTRYFRSLVDEFGGHLEYALAAYNAGTDRVQAWLSDGSYRGTDEFVESIPFTETREYVQAILRNAAIYKRLYGTP